MMKPILLAVLSFLSSGIANAQALSPFGAVPSTSQLNWHAMEYYMFIHFGPNTFTNKEWGHGDEDPNVFNPTQLDCRQWAATAKQAGMKGIIITAKHHDGFCLWPSHYSQHTVRESRWKDGQGDVLRDLSEACKEHGLKFGVYLSPWDRNHPDYGTEKYNQTFVSMLREVLGNYGEVFEQWFDGANGEGPNGKKQVYDWKLFNGAVYALQPEAIIFSDGGPGCRWVGNENGFAGETNWCTLNANKVYPGYPHAEELTPGHEGGTVWVPAECDVSIRPGWFYSPETGNLGTAWAPEGNQTTGTITLQFEKAIKFNRIVLQEDIALGQRIKSFSVEVGDRGVFKELARQTTIGHKRILRLPDTMASQIRIKILEAKAIPVLSEVGVYFSTE